MSLNHPAYEDLIAFAAGEHVQVQADFVRGHAATCAECSATIALFQSARTLSKAEPLESPPPAVLARAYALHSLGRQASKQTRSGIHLPRFFDGKRQAFPQFLVPRLGMARVLVGLVLAGALLLGGAGVMVAAAQSALPGDVLYPVKTTDEALQLAISPDAIGKTELHLRFAENRVTEIRALGALGRFDQVRPLAAAYEREVSQTVDQLEQASRDHPARAAALLPQVKEALGRDASALSLLRDSLPEGPRGDLEHAIGLSQMSAADVQYKMPTSTPTGVPLASRTPRATSTPTASAFNSVAPTATIESPGASKATGTPRPTDTRAPAKTPVPGETPMPPTGTLKPGATAQPAGTSQPSATPPPADGTPEPGGTSQPTDTSAPPRPSDPPTATPGPGETAEPSQTAVPSQTTGPEQTPDPSRTPKPTHTPKATHGPY